MFLNDCRIKESKRPIIAIIIEATLPNVSFSDNQIIPNMVDHIGTNKIQRRSDDSSFYKPFGIKVIAIPIASDAYKIGFSDCLNLLKKEK